MKAPKQAADEYAGYQEDESHAHFMAGYRDAMNQMNEAFQTKGALQYLIAVMESSKKDVDKFIAEHPGVHLAIHIPAEKDSLNYKWTQWAKQKIENLK